MGCLGDPFLLVDSLSLGCSTRERRLNFRGNGLVWSKSASADSGVKLPEVCKEALGNSLFILKKVFKKNWHAIWMGQRKILTVNFDCTLKNSIRESVTSRKVLSSDYVQVVKSAQGAIVKRYALLPALGLSDWSMGALSSWLSSTSGCSASDVTVRSAPSKWPPLS